MRGSLPIEVWMQVVVAKSKPKLPYFHDYLPNVEILISKSNAVSVPILFISCVEGAENRPCVSPFRSPSRCRVKEPNTDLLTVSGHLESLCMQSSKPPLQIIPRLPPPIPPFLDLINNSKQMSNGREIFPLWGPKIKSRQRCNGPACKMTFWGGGLW